MIGTIFGKWTVIEKIRRDGFRSFIIYANANADVSNQLRRIA